MTKTILFHFSHKFTGNRPWADVKLIPSHPSSTTHKCLVDTGADYLQLPALAASAVGIPLGPTTIKVSTASGSANMFLCKGIQVDIEGIKLSTDVLFDPTNTTSLIAGRTLLLSAFDIGFDTSEWHQS